VVDVTEKDETLRVERLAESAAVEALERKPIPEGDELLKADPSWVGLRRDFEAVVREMGFAAEATPPAGLNGLKVKLLARIAAEPQVKKALPPGGMEIVPGITAVLVEKAEWIATPLPGLEYKLLHIDEEGGTSTRLLRFAPGATYPSHRHGGPEEVFVLQGSVFLNGIRLKAGDYCRAEAGTTEPMAYSDEGGLAIIVSSDRDEFLPEAGA
jgi:hypothetical protein